MQEEIEPLFVNEEGQPFDFFIWNCSERERMKDLIHERFGNVNDDPNGAYTIQLADPNTYHSGEVYTINYISECCSTRKLLDLRNYRLNNTSEYSADFSPMDVLHRYITWRDAEVFRTQDEDIEKPKQAPETPHKTRKLSGSSSNEELAIIQENEERRQIQIEPSRASAKRNKSPVKRGSRYTSQEEKAIVKYISDNRACNAIKGVTIWKQMEDDKVCPRRTWQSLKEHFLKYILPRAEEYNFSKSSLTHLNKLKSKKKNSKRRDKVTNSATKESDDPLAFIGNRYLPEEDEGILKYISENRRYLRAGGVRVWQQMERKRIVPGRSWQSLKERYRKNLVNHLHKYVAKEKLNKLPAWKTGSLQGTTQLTPTKRCTCCFGSVSSTPRTSGKASTSSSSLESNNHDALAHSKRKLFTQRSSPVVFTPLSGVEHRPQMPELASLAKQSASYMNHVHTSPRKTVQQSTVSRNPCSPITKGSVKNVARTPVHNRSKEKGISKVTIDLEATVATVETKKKAVQDRSKVDKNSSSSKSSKEREACIMQVENSEQHGNCSFSSSRAAVAQKDFIILSESSSLSSSTEKNVNFASNDLVSKDEIRISEGSGNDQVTDYELSPAGNETESNIVPSSNGSCTSPSWQETNLDEINENPTYKAKKASLSCEEKESVFTYLQKSNKSSSFKGKETKSNPKMYTSERSQSDPRGDYTIHGEKNKQQASYPFTSTPIVIAANLSSSFNSQTNVNEEPVCFEQDISTPENENAVQDKEASAAHSIDKKGTSVENLKEADENQLAETHQETDMSLQEKDSDLQLPKRTALNIPSATADSEGRDTESSPETWAQKKLPTPKADISDEQHKVDSEPPRIETDVHDAATQEKDDTCCSKTIIASSVPESGKHHKRKLFTQTSSPVVFTPLSESEQRILVPEVSTLAKQTVSSIKHLCSFVGNTASRKSDHPITKRVVIDVTRESMDARSKVKHVAYKGSATSSRIKKRKSKVEKGSKRCAKSSKEKRSCLVQQERTLSDNSNIEMGTELKRISDTSSDNVGFKNSPNYEAINISTFESEGEILSLHFDDKQGSFVEHREINLPNITTLESNETWTESFKEDNMNRINPCVLLQQETGMSMKNKHSGLSCIQVSKKVWLDEQQSKPVVIDRMKTGGKVNWHMPVQSRKKNAAKSDKDGCFEANDNLPRNINSTFQENNSSTVISLQFMKETNTQSSKNVEQEEKAKQTMPNKSNAHMSPTETSNNNVQDNSTLCNAVQVCEISNSNIEILRVQEKESPVSDPYSQSKHFFQQHPVIASSISLAYKDTEVYTQYKNIFKHCTDLATDTKIGNPVLCSQSDNEVDSDISFESCTTISRDISYCSVNKQGIIIMETPDITEDEAELDHTSSNEQQLVSFNQNQINLTTNNRQSYNNNLDPRNYLPDECNNRSNFKEEVLEFIQIESVRSLVNDTETFNRIIDETSNRSNEDVETTLEQSTSKETTKDPNSDTNNTPETITEHNSNNYKQVNYCNQVCALNTLPIDEPKYSNTNKTTKDNSAYTLFLERLNNMKVEQLDAMQVVDEVMNEVLDLPSTNPANAHTVEGASSNAEPSTSRNFLVETSKYRHLSPEVQDSFHEILNIKEEPESSSDEMEQLYSYTYDEHSYCIRNFDSFEMRNFAIKEEYDDFPCDKIKTEEYIAEIKEYMSE